MSFECRVEADSISPDGVRLITFVVTFPRFILAEVNTHRMLSRNSASSRAIPVEKRIAAVKVDPFVPSAFGANQKGMQAGELLEDQEAARAVWLNEAARAVCGAGALAQLGVHKQLANRLLEPFSWHTAVISATDWANFFALRCHPDAQPEFQTIAGMMREAFIASRPELLRRGEWHLPFTTEAERREHSFDWRKISAGRCCRVSYLTHDGKRDPFADLNLAERLIAATPKHASPFEHQATPMTPADVQRGNFRGWRQFRHEIPNESTKG
jgi:thymidylate synthase ThyX